MAEIKSESVADFIPESVADLLRNQHGQVALAPDQLLLRRSSVRPAPAVPWADLPQAVDRATRDNAVAKLSGVCTLGKQPYPFPDFWLPRARLIDACGLERCLWATDWSREFG